MNNEFFNYCWSFYGKNQIYEIPKLTKKLLRDAIKLHLFRCNSKIYEHYTWGDGDSLDRERVRNIIEDYSNGIPKELLI